jgi:hypothetical protein
MKSIILFDITPCGLVEVHRNFKETYHFHRASCFLLISCFIYSLTLKIETVRSCETSVDFYRATRHYIAKESTIHCYRRENLRCKVIV